MKEGTFEATAKLAAYAYDVHDSGHTYDLYDIAAQLAINAEINPSWAIDAAYTLSQNHTYLTFEQWLREPDTSKKVELRVVLQENFVAYNGLAHLISYPPRTLVGSTLGKPHMGAHATAFSVQGPDTRCGILKTLGGTSDTGPFQTFEWAEFTEKRIRLLPVVNTINFEALKAASYAGFVATSQIPGEDLHRLSISKLKRITDAHLLRALHHITAITEAGVVLDNVSNNIHFGPQGFGFFDPIDLRRQDESVDEILKDNIRGFAENLTNQTHETLSPNRSLVSRSLRRHALERLKALAPNVPENVADILNILEYSPLP